MAGDPRRQLPRRGLNGRVDLEPALAAGNQRPAPFGRKRGDVGRSGRILGEKLVAPAPARAHGAGQAQRRKRAGEPPGIDQAGCRAGRIGRVTFDS